MISTRDLSGLSDIASFRRLTRALAMLDAILSQEWEFRYYSFNSRWGDGEMMASMRDGSGDHWFALISSFGVALHGLAHEAPTFVPGVPRREIFEGLPSELRANFVGEPAFDTANSTFCIWRRTTDDYWSSSGPPRLTHPDPDGSADLLSILAGDPRQYVDFAAEYFGREIDIADVAAIYQHQPLTEALVRRLNPEARLDDLADDILEIGYPDAA
jgi:hypothetical protein